MRLLIFFLLLMIPNMGEAASINLNFGDLEGGSATARMIQIILLMTVLTLAPSILVMMTSFTRIVIVLSFLRTAIGAQTTPPNQVLVALALFLTAFIMAPTLEKSYNDGILPLIEEEITEEQALERSAEPFRTFMLVHVRDKDLELFMNMAPEMKVEERAETPFRILIPAFMISELKRAFELGFLIFIPFLIIDLLVSSILMAMGMMMLPPVVISLPFKLIFFVLVDGWHMTAASLTRSFGL
ncbi:MAG: flagellar biosynthetic protein FliP [Alphaproteobacteria bacterium]|nr:MAG: flagellar biosynthetic protein FliP [Alphaproteobacteria bacterium]TAF15489.1 MAG: flagellar biosynthetic protein FliP [Alphaproteobacteria bacterium]